MNVKRVAEGIRSRILAVGKFDEAEHRTVLIVESDGGIRDLVCFMIRAVGYDAEVAADGATAVSKYREVHPDLVIIDQVLDDANGLGVCGRMRECGTGEEPPFIVLADHIRSSDRARTAHLGVANFFAKPPDLPALMNSVRLLLPASPASKTTLPIGH